MKRLKKPDSSLADACNTGRLGQSRSKLVCPRNASQVPFQANRSTLGLCPVLRSEGLWWWLNCKVFTGVPLVIVSLGQDGTFRTSELHIDSHYRRKQEQDWES